MKICIAQTAPKKGDVPANIKTHVKLIDLALTYQVEAIFFPELSLTGYEPELAKTLATHQNDDRLDIFQEISDRDKIIIGLGLPTKSECLIRISMIVFEPNRPKQTYSKQELHSDEFPYFENGLGQLIIETSDLKIAPAICYESLQPGHSEKAFALGANVYVASVAKPENGYKKALEHYPAIAKQFAMPVLMSNCVGFCDNFLSVGKSSIWNKDGELVAQLDDRSEGILVFDTETEKIIEKSMKMNP
jgi:predicted amidohydrolase